MPFGWSGFNSLILSQGFKYVEPSSGDCCGKCVQTHCVLNFNGTKELLLVGFTLFIGHESARSCF